MSPAGPIRLNLYFFLIYLERVAIFSRDAAELEEYKPVAAMRWKSQNKASQSKS